MGPLLTGKKPALKNYLFVGSRNQAIEVILRGYDSYKSGSEVRVYIMDSDAPIELRQELVEGFTIFLNIAPDNVDIIVTAYNQNMVELTDYIEVNRDAQIINPVAVNIHDTSLVSAILNDKLVISNYNRNANDMSRGITSFSDIQKRAKEIFDCTDELSVLAYKVCTMGQALENPNYYTNWTGYFVAVEAVSNKGNHYAGLDALQRTLYDDNGPIKSEHLCYVIEDQINQSLIENIILLQIIIKQTDLLVCKVPVK